MQYFFAAIFLLFSIRLVELQVFKYDTYSIQAKQQHERRSVLPARRGKILVRKNRLSKEVTPVATNNTLKLLFIDPMILNYPEYNPDLPPQSQQRNDTKKVAELLAPLLIHAHCEKIEGCNIKTDPETWTPAERERISWYRRELESIFSEIERSSVILRTDLNDLEIAQINTLALPGVQARGTSLVVDPTQIRSTTQAAEELADILKTKASDIKPLLDRRPRRYVEITNKIVPEVSQKILQLKQDPEYRLLLRGVGLKDEYWRYYPERNFASQVIGFVNNAGRGQYGIEEHFDDILRGKSGVIMGATNTRGQRIIGKSGNIVRAQDGDDIVLTIDRIIQGEIEKILLEDLEKFRADFAQAIVIEPSTGKIMAMVNVPSFDPNSFGEVHEQYNIPAEQAQQNAEDEFYNPRIPTLESKGNFFRYFNTWGPAVYRNKIVSDIYEPGSVMKAITMAAALNAGEVSPKTLYQDTGPIEVNEFTINNSDGIYAGPTSMMSILNRSLNTGIAYINRKMGSELVYEYFTKFGFSQFTDIDLTGEAQGQLEYWRDWDESELITRGYGQGITATPLQMAMAFSSLANGGYLMKPILVEEIIKSDGSVQTTEPQIIQRVISEETYQTIKAMLKNVVESPSGSLARMPGYSVMGKSGTSQSYRNGKAQTALGTTIASFAGFAPYDQPSFMVLVKFDFPKTSPWGSETAGFTFGRISKFLVQYLEIPPDR